MHLHTIKFYLISMLLTQLAFSQSLAPRDVPAKTIPVPNTVSPQMQAIIAQPLRTNWDKPPTTPEGWKQLSDGIATTVAPLIPAMAERMGVKIESSTLNGVRIYTITPNNITPENSKSCLLYTSDAADE